MLEFSTLETEGTVLLLFLNLQNLFEQLWDLGEAMSRVYHTSSTTHFGYRPRSRAWESQSCGTHHKDGYYRSKIHHWLFRQQGPMGLWNLVICLQRLVLAPRIKGLTIAAQLMNGARQRLSLAPFLPITRTMSWHCRSATPNAIVTVVPRAEQNSGSARRDILVDFKVTSERIPFVRGNH